MSRATPPLAGRLSVPVRVAGVRGADGLRVFAAIGLESPYLGMSHVTTDEGEPGALRGPAGVHVVGARRRWCEWPAVAAVGVHDPDVPVVRVHRVGIGDLLTVVGPGGVGGAYRCVGHLRPGRAGVG